MDITTKNKWIQKLRSPTYYRQHGGILSKQRVEVIETFIELDRTIAVEDLWLHMVNSGRGVSLSCVRSSLNWLVKQKLAANYKPPNSRWQYCTAY